MLLEELKTTLILFFDFLGAWIFPVLKTWWWIVLPFLLYKPAISFWLWWRRELFFKDIKYILLEIKLPVEILKPIKAMEDVFSTVYGIVADHETDNFREVWIEGESTIYPTISLEVTSFGGESHFFVWVEDNYRTWIESALYAQYPEIEITEVEDYTKRVPQDVPNEKWDVEGRDFVLRKEGCYPIKTYTKFETGTEPKEEKRVDPVAKLLEALSVFKEGEQVWIQILPILTSKKWLDEGKAIRDKLVKRSGGASSPKPIIQEVIEFLLFGANEEEEKKEEKLLYPEMMLTPGEREVVKEIEIKMSKPGMDVAVRVLYIGKREVFFKPHMGPPISFIMDFNTGDLNRFGTYDKSTTKIKTVLTWRLDKRRMFLRKRQFFRNYRKRLTPLFPYPGGVSVLNIEELASMYHFPGRAVAPAPSVPRIEAKKGEAPSELPIEE